MNPKWFKFGLHQSHPSLHLFNLSTINHIIQSLGSLCSPGEATVGGGWRGRRRCDPPVACRFHLHRQRHPGVRGPERAARTSLWTLGQVPRGGTVDSLWERSAPFHSKKSSHLEFRSFLCPGAGILVCWEDVSWHWGSCAEGIVSHGNHSSIDNSTRL